MLKQTAVSLSLNVITKFRSSAVLSVSHFIYHFITLQLLFNCYLFFRYNFCLFGVKLQKQVMALVRAVFIISCAQI